MSAHAKRFNVSFLCVVLAAGLAVPAGFARAAEQASAAQIIQALKLPKVTRGLTTSPTDAARAADEGRFIETVRNRVSRSLSTEEREKIASIAKAKPTIDLEINFEFNSATISSTAMPQVTALGEALTSSDLKGRTFLLAGHTDAKGSDTYNQGLSERRTEAVKRFLQEKYGIETINLVAVGYGKTQLKNPSDPFGFENRRVQIVNMAEK
jgi:outer membrane protein OmpA-like peptidoglycan-associated protein